LAQLPGSFAATPLLLKKIIAQLSQDAIMGPAKFVTICSSNLSDREDSASSNSARCRWRPAAPRETFVLVDDVALIVDLREVPCGSEDLLRCAGRDDHLVIENYLVPYSIHGPAMARVNRL
jgi:hypothetical protein